MEPAVIEDGEERSRRGLVLTDSMLIGLFFIQRYRFLTIDQYAKAASLKRATASDQLRSLERHGILGHFGNIGLRGHGKTPKVYFLKRKGYELLLRESDIPSELIGSFKEAHTTTRWSPQMYHRLHTVDLMIAAEFAVRERANLSIVVTFLEYRRVKVGNRYQRETTDLVAEENMSENRIIPDAALIIENVESGKRGLFFLEIDMGTERIVTRITSDKRITLHHKLVQYDRYLMSGRFTAKYGAYGDFSFFTLLFVTTSKERVENVRREMSNLPDQLAHYHRFSTYDEAINDFLGSVWKNRSFEDNQTYALVSQ